MKTVIDERGFFSGKINMSKENITESELPRIIDGPYPYVAIGDLSDVAKRITGYADINVQTFQSKLNSMFKEIMPSGSTFYPVMADDINTEIEKRVRAEIENPYKKIGVVNLDRYLCSNIKSGNIFPINISRNINGGLSSRPGETASPEDQIASLVNWCNDNNFQELLITDDVLAFGDTLVPFINGLKGSIPIATNIRVLVGLASSGGSWRGIEKVKEETGITPEFLTLINASLETDLTLGMAIPTSRDFTFLGGKISQIDNLSISFPYLLPFSIPAPSFMPIESRVNVAKELFSLNRSLGHT